MAEHIDVVAIVRIHADKVPEALPLVKQLVESSRAEEGVLRYDVHGDTQ